MTRALRRGSAVTVLVTLAVGCIPDDVPVDGSVELR
jgi:hypothetical protein